MTARRDSRPGLAWSFFFALVSLVSGVTATKAGQKQGAVYTNHLAGEKSPYLLQHAAQSGRLVSVGRRGVRQGARRRTSRSFSPSATRPATGATSWRTSRSRTRRSAAIMNREFVNIKVDREERPDVDRVYMTFVQATTGGGGWPMSVWLTPELKPFVGGTYFPPEDRHGQPGFHEGAAAHRGRLEGRSRKDFASREARSSRRCSKRPPAEESGRGISARKFCRAALSADRAELRCARGRFRRCAEISAPGHR